MNAYIGQIILFAGNFAPRNWALCDGQILTIANNTALFSILGTTYGGDGRTTFGLPDLRGRVAVHAGTGPGLSPYRLGQAGGAEGVSLDVSSTPSHSHAVAAAAGAGLVRSDLPGGKIFASSTSLPFSAGVDSSHSTEVTGSGNAHNNMSPFTCVNHIICLIGTYPSRN